MYIKLTFHAFGYEKYEQYILHTQHGIKYLFKTASTSAGCESKPSKGNGVQQNEHFAYSSIS